MERSQWRFVFDGHTYEYLGYVSAPDAILIKKHTGLSVLGMYHGIITSDPEALVAMVYLAKRQAGETVGWDELVDLMVGENDLMALVDSVEPLKETPAKPTRKPRTQKSETVEQEPAPVA